MRIRPRYLIPPLALGVILATTAAGCGSSSSGSGSPNHEVVPGSTNEAVTCTETPYDAATGRKDAGGSGISIVSGHIRGALWVSCTPPGPDSWQIVVIVVRNGQEVGGGSVFASIPDATGYEAWSISTCLPATYHVYYRYIWKLQGGVQQNTNIKTADRVVTAHDCDA